MALFPSTALASSADSHSSEITSVREGELIDEPELPSHTWPHGCLVLTKKSLYVCQTRLVDFIL